jgi:NAD+ synthase
MNFNTTALNIDAEKETARLVEFIRRTTHNSLRRGAVIGISGGIDSAVVMALSVRAFGARKVIPVMMPDRDSDALSEIYARELAASFGVEPVLENITAALTGAGCYARRDAAIQRVFPEYDSTKGWKARIVLPQDLLDGGTLNIFSLSVFSPDGREESRALPPREMLEIVAATNIKQRTRMATLYFHAESRQYAVIGTANRNEFAQGFFVKYGDGGVDLQPIAHLYKSQVYQLGRHLNVPESIQRRSPTTDTYSAPCDQQEFFFRLPFDTLDFIWFALDQGIPAAEAAKAMGLTEIQVQRVFEDIQRKQRTTTFLRLQPPIPEATAP